VACCISVNADGAACGRGLGNPIAFFSTGLCGLP
jgi:hypothetical protein